MFERIALVAVLGGVLGMLPLLPAGAETMGSVVSTAGDAFVEGADGRRPLDCGAAVGAGERIVTAAGARLALVAGDVYLQMSPGAGAAVGRTAAGAPSIEISSGQVRLVDMRPAGAPPLVIATPHSQASGFGTDTEVTVSGAGSELCEAAADLEVTALEGDASIVARRGECVTLGSGAAPSTAPKGAPRIALAGAEGCIEVAAVDHFTPGVAAPPPTIGLAPLDPDRRVYGPCEELGCLEVPPGGDVFERPPLPDICAIDPASCFGD
jgi:hypothetical protein